MVGIEQPGQGIVLKFDLLVVPFLPTGRSSGKSFDEVFVFYVAVHRIVSCSFL